LGKKRREEEDEKAMSLGVLLEFLMLEKLTISFVPVSIFHILTLLSIPNK